jgi:alpha-amylase
VVTVDLASGAGIGSWDVRPVRHALAAVMRRRPEAYHETLRAHEAAQVQAAAAHAVRDGKDGNGPASIHDIVLIKERGLSDQLHYDPYERRSGLVRFLAPGTDAASWASARAAELGDAIDGAFDVERLELDRLVATRDAMVSCPGSSAPTAVRVTKEFLLGGGRRDPTLELALTVENRSGQAIEALLGLEWTLTMLGGGGNPSAWWEVGGVRTGHDTHGSAPAISELAQGNDYVGVAVSTRISIPATAWWSPVETISNSESGFERVYQGSGLLLSWPLVLAAGGAFSVQVRHTVTTSRDRASEEATAAMAPLLGR